MMDLSRFSDLFAQMAPGFGPSSLFGNTQAETGKPGPPKAPEAPTTPEAPGVLKDILDLSKIASNHPFASFDRAEESEAEPKPIAVADDGRYQPTQVQHRLSTSLNFSFSMSLQQSSVIQRSSDAGRSVTRAMESTQFAYQSMSSRQELGNSYSELQQFETSMFFSRTRSLSETLSTQTGERVESSGRSVARRFEIGSSLDFKALRQYNVQTESLSDNEATLNQYLDGVDGLAGRSGDGLKAFFDEVDQILADTEAYVKDTLGSFLTDVKAAFGLNETESNDLVGMIADEVGAFFSEVGAFLDEAQSALTGSGGPESEALEADEAELALV